MAGDRMAHLWLHYIMYDYGASGLAVGIPHGLIKYKNGKQLQVVPGANWQQPLAISDP